jgi:VWFA-related protein
MLAILSLLAAPAHPQDPVFRTEIALVKVDAEVAGKSGVIDGLRAEDFVVLDNGQPQAIRYFSQEEEPLDIVLLFDISDSMGPSIQKVAASARIAMSELRPGDRVAVMSFNTRVWTEAPFTADLDAVAARLIARIRSTRFSSSQTMKATARPVPKLPRAIYGMPTPSSAVSSYPPIAGWRRSPSASAATITSKK